VEAARAAAGQAREAARVAPKLAIAFTGVGYADLDGIPAALREVFGDIPIIGGTAGGTVFAAGASAPTCARLGVSVIALGGDDIEIEVQSAPTDDGLLQVVRAAERVRAAAEEAEGRGFSHYLCLMFAPGIHTDGDSFVAAVRKGAGERAMLAGGLTGDDFALNHPKVFAERELVTNRAVLAGVFSRNPIGVAARHGWRPIGQLRTITRTEGVDLIELDGRAALEVWREDARQAGLEAPAARRELELWLGRYFSIGIVPDGAGRARRKGDSLEPGPELVVRTPMVLRDDGAVRLSAAIGEGTRVRVLHARRDDLLKAADDVAITARAAAGTGVAGALVLSCAGRLLALDDRFAEEPEAIATRIGAPVAGACVYGEIARNIRDVHGFFNTTAVVVAFGKK
jgi:hypothetical protein